MNNIPSSVRVEFWWNEGIRRELPIGGRYSTIAKVPGDNQPWPETAWSFVVNFPSGYRGLGKTIGEAHFLVESAPSHLLHPGTVVELFEGKKLAAFAQVVSSIEDPMDKSSIS